MNRPTDYPVIAFQITKEKKMALYKYSKMRGQSMTWVLNQLVDSFVGEEIRIQKDFKQKLKSTSKKKVK